jgi:hypothetical protein
MPTQDQLPTPRSKAAEGAARAAAAKKAAQGLKIFAEEKANKKAELAAHRAKESSAANAERSAAVVASGSAPDAKATSEVIAAPATVAVVGEDAKPAMTDAGSAPAIDEPGPAAAASASDGGSAPAIDEPEPAATTSAAAAAEGRWGQVREYVQPNRKICDELLGMLEEAETKAAPGPTNVDPGSQPTTPRRRLLGGLLSSSTKAKS